MTPAQTQNHAGTPRILRLRRGVSRFTYIFSISLSGRLDPSGKLTNFHPPPSPRFPFGPSFSTVKFQPLEGRRLLYLWRITFPATCIQEDHIGINEKYKTEYCKLDS